MGKSPRQDHGPDMALLDVLVVPSCDADPQIQTLTGWPAAVLRNAGGFSATTNGSHPLKLLQARSINPRIWASLLGDAHPDTDLGPTPIAPDGVALGATSTLATTFYQSANSGPIDPTNHAPQQRFLQSIHQEAIGAHGLYVAHTTPGPAEIDSSDPQFQATRDVLRLMEGDSHATAAATLIQKRLGHKPPVLNAAGDKILIDGVSTGKRMVHAPNSAVHTLAHLQLHLARSLKAAGYADYSGLNPTHAGNPHLLYHFHRLVASATRRHAAEAKKVASAVISRSPYGFNKRITLLMNMPALLETLGLVLHFQLPWSAIGPQVTLDPSSWIQGFGTPTYCTTLCTPGFLPRPKSSPGSIRANGWVEPTDGYHVGSLQLDSAAMQITQFASQAGLRATSSVVVSRTSGTALSIGAGSSAAAPQYVTFHPEARAITTAITLTLTSGSASGVVNIYAYLPASGTLSWVVEDTSGNTVTFADGSVFTKPGFLLANYPSAVLVYSWTITAGAFVSGGGMPPPTVTISYDEDVDHPLLPPSPQTGGLQVWQDNLQENVVAKRNAIIQNSAAAPPQLYAEDLKNGAVVDIRAVNPGDNREQWIHLCTRDEEFDVDGQKVRAKRVDRGVKTAASRSIAPSATNSVGHGVDETIFTWRLGSLVAKSPVVNGAKAIPSGTELPKPPDSNQQIPWNKLPKPKLQSSDPSPSPLFGWNYQVAMRAAFVTGGVVPFDPAAALAASLPAQTFQRYELIEGPALIPVDFAGRQLSDQSATLLFYGSKVAAGDLSVTNYSDISQRLIVPAQVTPDVARRHGKPEDLINDGATTLPLDNGALPLKVTAFTETGNVGEKRYLPDPLCIGVWAILTDLDGKVIDTKWLEYYNAAEGASWPHYAPHMLELHPSTNSTPSIEVGNITIPPLPNPPSFLNRALSKAFICRIPAGKTFLLALRPKLDPSVETVHALSKATQAWNGVALNTYLLALSDVCRPTVARLTHATDRPIIRPTTDPASPNPVDVSDPTSVKLGAKVDALSTSKVSIVANWQETTDNLNQPSYTTKPLTARLTEFKVHKKDSGDITPALVQFPFADSCFRQVTVTASGTARYGDVFGKDDKQSRTLDSVPLVLRILATKPPQPPDIEYVLPNLRWELNRETHTRTRTMGLTVVLNRPWFTSGAGEQLAVIIAPCPDPAAPFVDRISTTFPTANAEDLVSSWGVLGDWWAASAGAAAGKQIRIYADTSRVGDKDNAAPPPDLANQGIVMIDNNRYYALFYTPRYNDQDQQWYVNLNFDSPPAYGAVVRLLTARYQQHATTGNSLSKVSMCDFSLLRPGRSVSITRIGSGFDRKIRIQVRGIGPRVPEAADGTGLPRAVMEVRKFETRLDLPHGFDWRAGSVVPMDSNLPNTGDILWQATLPFPWTGGTLAAQEWEVWPTAEDPSKAAALPVYSDIFPI
jgi:hypothetical protein